MSTGVRSVGRLCKRWFGGSEASASEACYSGRQCHGVPSRAIQCHLLPTRSFAECLPSGLLERLRGLCEITNYLQKSVNGWWTAAGSNR